MTRIARDHRFLLRTLIAAAFATLAVAAPASALPADAPGRVPARQDVTFVAKTCGGPNEIIECAPPVESPAADVDSLVAKTCGGPNEIIECPPPVEAEPRRVEAVRPS